jgi:hypothetical protein
VLESDTVRPPLAPMTAPSRDRMRAILEECGLL